MGLDMYLYARKYVSAFEIYPEDKAICGKIKEALGLGAEDYESVRVTIQVAYWRKANQIHAWFVDNIQNGVDECQETYVRRDQLVELTALCRRAIELQDATLLEPRSGFFFGSTEVDEYYWSDLENTVEMLESVLADTRLGECDFTYQSSW